MSTIHTNPSIAHGFPGDECLDSTDRPKDDEYSKALETIVDLTPYVELVQDLKALADKGAVNDMRRTLVVFYAAQKEALEREPRSEAEHYYSHMESDYYGRKKLYFCACGKEDANRDRLLRHIAWQEKRLQHLKETTVTENSDEPTMCYRTSQENNS